VSAHGFEHGTTFFRMRIDHTGPVVVPDPPAGTTVRVGAPDEDTRRAVHAVMAAAFEGQENAAIRPYDDWVERHENRSSFDWSQLVLVEADGRPVAASDCNNAYVETDNCGYVGRLAVIPEARGLGLAKYLLRQAFATDAAAGYAGTMLHVDTNNPTPALGLYEAVGMRPVQIADVWELTL
jgi:ribosomal protein S18 acetylase RimI-like enzyme